MKITDEQVLVALDAAQQEMECWRIFPIGPDNDYRGVRTPPAAPLDAVPEDVGDTTVTVIVLAPGEKGKKEFNLRRTFAGMRKALESLNATE